MATINEQIDKILDMRLGRNAFKGKGHLQDVEAKIAALEEIRNSIVQLQSCTKAVDLQISNHSGEFYKALYSDPNAMTAFKQLDCVGALISIDNALSNLKKLQKRFEREAVRIAFIGYERQGKSTFLQSMTGLPNEVIPAYDGTSCTGAVSVIHNEETETSFRAEIEFYTVQEFLDNVKAKLKILMPEKNFAITSLDDLANIDLSTYSGKDKTETEKLIKNNIIGHRNFYGPFLGKGVQTYTDKDTVMKFVAQYREYPTRKSIPSDAHEEDIKERIKEKNLDGTPKSVVWRHMYYWYLAVKSVNIYCKFPNQECGRIEFVDTVGLGPSVNADAVEQEMFRVLKEDCDGAIDVYCPASTGGSINDKELNIFAKLEQNLSSRTPKMWLSYAINAIPRGEKCNIQNIVDILGDLSLKDLPFGFYVDVNAADRKDVNDRLLVPHLEMISANLETLDNNLLNRASEDATLAYNQCQSLLKTATKVIPVNSITDWKFEKDGFIPMLHDFNIEMNNIDHDGYAKNKDKQCPELTAAYEDVISSIDKDLPSEEDLVDRFKSGVLRTTSEVFGESIEEMRNGIFEVFEGVNKKVLHPLQEKVKSDLIKVLFNQGKMAMLPLPIGSPIEPTNEWMESVIKNYIPQEKYPALYETLRYVLDYKISIEGLVEYNVTNSLHIIEKDHEDFIPYSGENPNDYSEKGAQVWQELASRLMPLQKRLRSWMGDFALIPSQSFYSRVHKFHIKIGTNVNGVRDFKDFYHDNMGLIWHDEIEGKARENAAFSDWTNCLDAVRKAMATNLFSTYK